MFKTKNTQALEAARATLAETNGQIDELRQRRQAALLESADTATILIFDQQIGELERIAKAQADRVTVLGNEVEKEEAARRVKNRADRIGRIETIANDRAKRGPRIENAIDTLLDLIEEDVEDTKRILPAWPWNNSDREVLKPFAQGIRELLCYEFYRKSALRFMNTPGAVTLAGSVCERDVWRLRPQDIPSLTDRLREIADHASRTMRGGRLTIQPKLEKVIS